MTRALAVGSLLGVVFSGATAFAAALVVASSGLTAWSAASSVPVSRCTLDASADTYVDSGSTGGNFGGATELQVASALTGNRRTLTRFDVASCVPAGARVTTATLRLRLSTAPLVSRTYAVHRVTAPWTESVVTWSSQPSVAPSASAETATGTTGGITLSWGVTSDVQAFVDGAGNHGWRLSDSVDDAFVAQSSVFPSREAASDHPVLSIDYYP